MPHDRDHPDQCLLVLPGEVVPAAGDPRRRIAEVQPGRSHAAGAIDLDGDHLMPGVVDVHTDNLERQVQPRPTRAGRRARRCWRMTRNGRARA